MDLAAPLPDVYALLGGNHGIAVEVGRPLLELGEILDALQRPLGAEQSLDVQPSQRRRVEAMPEFLGANITHQVRRCRYPPRKKSGPPFTHRRGGIKAAGETLATQPFSATNSRAAQTAARMGKRR